MGLARLIISKRSANNAGPYLGLNLALTSGAAALPMAAVPMLGGYLLLNRKFLRLLSQVGGLPMAAGGAAWGVVDYWAMALGICAGLAQTLVNSCRTMDTINLHYQLDEPRLK